MRSRLFSVLELFLSLCESILEAVGGLGATTFEARLENGHGGWLKEDKFGS